MDNGHGQYTLVGVLNSQSDCGDTTSGSTNPNPPLSYNRIWTGTGAGGLPLVYAKVSGKMFILIICYFCYFFSHYSACSLDHASNDCQQS